MPFPGRRFGGPASPAPPTPAPPPTWGPGWFFGPFLRRAGGVIPRGSPGPWGFYWPFLRPEPLPPSLLAAIERACLGSAALAEALRAAPYGGIHRDMAPPGERPPYLVLHQIAATERRTFTGDCLRAIEVQVDCTTPGRSGDPPAALAALVRRLFDPQQSGRKPLRYLSGKENGGTELIDDFLMPDESFPRAVPTRTAILRYLFDVTEVGPTAG